MHPTHLAQLADARLRSFLATAHRREEGAPVAEYAILVALVASALVATVLALRGRIEGLLKSATF